MKNTMEQVLRIRTLNAEDADSLLSFYTSLPDSVRYFFEPFPKLSKNVLTNHLKAADAGEAISMGVVDKEGAVLGHAFILGIRDEKPVFGIGLIPCVYGQGWGKKMMEAVLKRADELGLPRMTLTVIKGNQRAFGLYKKMGFEVKGEHTCHEKNDSFFMERVSASHPVSGAKIKQTSMLDSFMKLLQGEKPDRIVWTADITYWIAGQKQAGIAKPEWDTEEGYLRLHRDLGIFPYYYYEKFWLAEAKYSSEIQTSIETMNPTSVCRIRTPVGELVGKTSYLSESCCTGCTKHYVESEDDLDVLQYILEHRRLVPANLADYRRRMEIWRKYDGLPAIGLPRSPLASFCYEWAGVENTVYLLMDCEKKVANLLRLMAEQETPILDAISDVAPPLVHFPDNLSSDNLAGLYDKYLAADHQRRIERLHAAGIRCAVHLDGTVRGLLHKLVQVGFDAIEALTPKPAGDLDVSEIDALAGNERVIL